MKTICIIPARGGSKRIPRKNILKLNGIPLIVYTIRAAKEAGVFDKIVLTTDDKEIKIEILPYHRLATDKYKSLGMEYQGNALSTPEKKKIEAIKQQATETGLIFV